MRVLHYSVSSCAVLQTFYDQSVYASSSKQWSRAGLALEPMASGVDHVLVDSDDVHNRSQGDALQRLAQHASSGEHNLWAAVPLEQEHKAAVNSTQVQVLQGLIDRSLPYADNRDEPVSVMDLGMGADSEEGSGVSKRG